MAEMVPESISTSSDATAGEKRIFRILRDALQPDEDFLVWFEPSSIRRRTDFLIWAQELGLLVIEVKDWSTSMILEMNPQHWKVERHGRAETVESPLEQARRVCFGYKDLLSKSAAFVQTGGPHAGRLKFAIGYCCVFTNITRKQAKEFGIPSVVGDALCLYNDDLQFDCEQRSEQRSFVARLRQCFPVRFPFNPLTQSRAENASLRHLSRSAGGEAAEASFL